MGTPNHFFAPSRMLTTTLLKRTIKSTKLNKPRVPRRRSLATQPIQTPPRKCSSKPFSYSFIAQVGSVDAPLKMEHKYVFLSQSTPYSPPSGWRYPTTVDPHRYPNTIVDIDETNLHGDIGEKLGVEYLSTATHPGEFPVHGVIAHRRAFVNLVVTNGTKSVNVIFFLGSGRAYVSPAVLEKLFDTVPETPVNVEVQGLPMKLHKSPEDSWFPMMNVLGIEAFLLHPNGPRSLAFTPEGCTIK